MHVCVYGYLFFRRYGEFVAGDETANLLHAQVEELLALHHLREVLLCVCMNEKKRKKKHIQNTITNRLEYDAPFHAIATYSAVTASLAFLK